MGNVNLLYGTGREEVSIGLFCFWSGRIKDGCVSHRFATQKRNCRGKNTIFIPVFVIRILFKRNGKCIRELLNVSINTISQCLLQLSYFLFLSYLFVIFVSSYF